MVNSILFQGSSSEYFFLSFLTFSYNEKKKGEGFFQIKSVFFLSSKIKSIKL